MIKINQLVKKNKLVGFELKGHAMYAEGGKDIVCAAVSALTYNTINSLYELACCDVNLEQKNGFMSFKVIEINDNATLLLNTLELGYKSLQETYKYYIFYSGRSETCG